MYCIRLKPVSRQIKQLTHWKQQDVYCWLLFGKCLTGTLREWRASAPHFVQSQTIMLSSRSPNLISKVNEKNTCKLRTKGFFFFFDQIFKVVTITYTKSSEKPEARSLDEVSTYTITCFQNYPFIKLTCIFF